ncbi:hypothetical protein E2542_SST20396 [Spatholobus suberectus]|nr:hypothetical protein E2542_SST20396 [Spatholobus suberectus]
MKGHQLEKENSPSESECNYNGGETDQANISVLCDFKWCVAEDDVQWSRGGAAGAMNSRGGERVREGVREEEMKKHPKQECDSSHLTVYKLVAPPSTLSNWINGSVTICSHVNDVIITSTNYTCKQCKYDKEVDSGEDQPIIIVSPTNSKALGISSDVHQVLNSKEKSWKRGQKIKVLKRACTGCHKTTIYAICLKDLKETLEVSFVIVVHMAIDIPEENGCFLSVKDENASLDIRGSLSLPISVIDTGKLVAVESIEWENRLKKKQQKSPSIYLPSANHYEHLEANGIAVAMHYEVHGMKISLSTDKMTLKIKFIQVFPTVLNSSLK